MPNMHVLNALFVGSWVFRSDWAGFIAAPGVVLRHIAGRITGALRVLSISAITTRV